MTGHSGSLAGEPIGYITEACRFVAEKMREQAAVRQKYP
jgi:hypothetical protein